MLRRLILFDNLILNPTQRWARITLYPKRSKTRRSFQPAKAQRKMRNLIFLLSEARSATSAMNFLIQLKRNAIPERYFCTKLKCNLTSAIEISQHNANTAFFAILD